MTFDAIVTEIKDRLGLTSSEATTRIGREVNTRYRRVSSARWMDPMRRTRVTGATTNNSEVVTFSNIEAIERVVDDNGATLFVLQEVTFDELAKVTLAATAISAASRYAIKSMTGSTVTIMLSHLANGVFNLKADGIGTVADLSGSGVPVIPVSFHDILIEGVVADELRRMEKQDLANISEQLFDRRVEECRLFVTKASGADIKRIIT